MAVDVIVGLQRGDEGKGRFVDMWMENYDIGVRYSGGPNAGHTVVSPEGRMIKLHTIPSGITYDGKKNVIGDGVFVDAVKLNAEIDYLRGEGVQVSTENLMISSSAHLILPHHIVLDAMMETGNGQQGSTKSGIRHVAADFGLRTGVRAETIKNKPDELYEAVCKGLVSTGPAWQEVAARLGLSHGDEKGTASHYVKQAELLGDYITDTMLFLNKALGEGKSVLAEGAQAFLLDKYQGMWPFVTSAITTAGGVSPGLGVPPQSIQRVLGVIKAIHSHVGGGHFVTEIKEPKLMAALHGDMTAPDAEFGTTTNRTRRLGYLDLPVIRRANMANGTTEMAITKLDWLSRHTESIPVCTAYTRNGIKLSVAPNAEYKLQESTPEYTELPAWNEDISGIRRFQDLPKNARGYIQFIEKQVGVPITLIGVGPRRDQVITR